MIIVLVYAGGEIIYEEKAGASYSIPPKITFPAIKSTTLEDVKNEIFRGLDFSEVAYSLVIKVRNVVQTNVEEEAYVGEETDNEGNIDEDEDQEDVEEGSEDEENMNDSIALVNSAKSQPLMGRSGKHPTRADDCFFGSKRHFESPLAKGRIFYSKQHLQFAVNEFHISNNMEVRVSTSNKSRLDFKCKDSTCKWKLYAKTTKIGSSWKIQTCQFPHTCRAPADRFDHAQLTAAVIADVIRDDLKENLELSILSIRQLVRQRYKNVKPKYNKLWRGRELAIVQLFSSWEESYALVTPLLEAMKASNPGASSSGPH
uniref:Uncharacterized protein n=1 Tax=Oryza nivara TaxID=4536 RepID=A0A0E0I588_ORYNI